MVRPFTFFLFLLVGAAQRDPALNVSRGKPYFAAFHNASVLLNNAHSNGEWAISIMVRVLEGRASAILSPMLDIVETQLGLRIRGCGYLPGEVNWTCVCGRRLWRDDGEWHLFELGVKRNRDNASSFSLELMMDGEDIGDAASSPRSLLAVADDARPRPLSHYVTPQTHAIWIGRDVHSGEFPLSGLVRNFSLCVGEASFNCLTSAGSMPTQQCSGKGSFSWYHWSLSGTLADLCGGTPLLLLAAESNLSPEPADPNSYLQLLNTHVIHDTAIPYLWTAAQPKLNVQVTERIDMGTNPTMALGTSIKSPYSMEKLLSEVIDRLPEALIPAFRESILLFASEPDETFSDATSLRTTSDPYYVIYYSKDNEWDVMWRLYHDWLVHVVLREVRQIRPVRVILDRCIVRSNTRTDTDRDSMEAGTESCRLVDLLMMNDSLVVLNAHQNPKVSPLYAYAALLQKQGVTRGVGLLHQNHEQPLRTGNHRQLGSARKNTQASALRAAGYPVPNHLYSDWRNGYPGGLPGLAESYAAAPWSFVVRQYYFKPLAPLVEKVHRDGLNGLGPRSNMLTQSLSSPRFGFLPLGLQHAHFLWQGRVVVDNTRLPEDRLTPIERAALLRAARRPASERRDLCFFAGTATQFGGTPDRENMIRVVTSMNDDARRRKEKIVCNIFTGKPPPDIDEPQKHALSYQEYLFGMRQSIFALAPHGNNPETFRHWEAMEMGAIPISVWPPENLSYLKIWCNGRVGGKDDEQKDPLFDINTPPGNFSFIVSSRECPLVLLGSWEALPRFLEHYRSTIICNRQADFGRGTQQSDFDANTVCPSIDSEHAAELDTMQANMLQWLHDIKRRVADDFASFVITPKVAIVLTGDVLPCSSRDKLVTTLKDADVFVATYTDHSKYVSSLGARRWVHLMDREKIRYPAGLAKEDMQSDMFQWMHLNFIIAEHADILHSYDLVLKVRFDVLHQDDFMTQIKRLALNAKKKTERIVHELRPCIWC